MLTSHSLYVAKFWNRSPRNVISACDPSGETRSRAWEDMVETKPSGPLHWSGSRVHGNHFQVDVGAESQQQVVRRHVRMRPPCTGQHAEGSLDVGSAGLKSRRDNRNVIEASDHGRSGT
jgi:hypothetical protein